MKRTFLGTLILMGVLAPVTWTPAREGQDPEHPVALRENVVTALAQAADTVLVHIEVEGDSVKAVPDVATVVPGQVVVWISDLGDWTVRFLSPRPFGEEASQAGIQGARGRSNGRAVEASAPDGRYKYMIQVRDGNRVRVRDPEIVVRRGGER